VEYINLGRTILKTIIISKSQINNLELALNNPIYAWSRLGDHQFQALVLDAGEGLGKTSAEDPNNSQLTFYLLSTIF
jgi:hypothetical protein